MSKQKVKAKDLVKIGYPKGATAGFALLTLLRHYKHLSGPEQLTLMKAVLEDPQAYMDDAVLGRVAARLAPRQAPLATDKPFQALFPEPQPYTVFGSEGIEASTCKQMDTVMRIPVAVSGALLPDAHVGMGMPVGGVLATANAVVPQAVGVDIGCRMSLSIFPLPVNELVRHRDHMVKILYENTRFGPFYFSRPMDDAVLERPEFREIRVVAANLDKARKQIGSSGSGNHFVELGEVNLPEGNSLGLPGGAYLGLLSHSGSRALGANIAQHYIQVAQRQWKLPREAWHLAWLMMDSEAGQEYWAAMNLAGDYAVACHAHIHRRMARALGEKPLITVENHHNFAWKEVFPDGSEMIVHRKGATPAQPGVLGIIPGSMATPGYIVRGRATAASLFSASHGAGRRFSRSEVKNHVTASEVRKMLEDKQVTLIGGGLDEAPQAYKDIGSVMHSQADLVEIVGSFRPRIVRMDGGAHDPILKDPAMNRERLSGGE